MGVYTRKVVRMLPRQNEADKKTGLESGEHPAQGRHLPIILIICMIAYVHIRTHIHT